MERRRRRRKEEDQETQECIKGKPDAYTILQGTIDSQHEAEESTQTTREGTRIA